MSFIILEIIEKIEQREGFFSARVSHYDHILPVWISNQPKIEPLIGCDISVEINHHKILSWHLSTDFQDNDSGIWSDAQGIHLKGSVHNLMELETGETLIDIYLQHGPEFICVISSEIAGIVPAIKTGIEILVDEITLYPYQN